MIMTSAVDASIQAVSPLSIRTSASVPRARLGLIGRLRIQDLTVAPTAGPLRMRFGVGPTVTATRLRAGVAHARSTWRCGVAAARSPGLWTGPLRADLRQAIHAWSVSGHRLQSPPARCVRCRPARSHPALTGPRPVSPGRAPLGCPPRSSVWRTRDARAGGEPRTTSRRPPSPSRRRPGCRGRPGSWRSRSRPTGRCRRSWGTGSRRSACCRSPCGCGSSRRRRPGSRS